MTLIAAGKQPQSQNKTPPGL